MMSVLRLKSRKRDQESRRVALYICESTRRAIKRWANEAGTEGFISGHSLRVGSAISPARAGASVVDMQTAGRWQSPSMPAHYAKAVLAERGAIARLKDGK
ncbi:MAG: hypothetical protein OXN17_07870 [Candidatus Poribacteria bacterium]|nr:hypothetical protein [Candidatus Poribacteria bacterium]MDE0505911.1 hypothetical protein [Candidatus Poribacteria bacterium]